ncbi:MAG: NAD(P)-dependent alcohol dehydrogenase [Cyanobacteria bacterium P01_F01_bin.150]
MVIRTRTAGLANSNVSNADTTDQNTVQSSRQMNVIDQTRYGSPDVLHLQRVEKPVPKDNEVLIKNVSSSVNAGDWHLMRGTPFLIRLIFGGWFKPAIRTLGIDVAGRIEAVGANVTQFKPGDEVFGDASSSGFGGFAEYVCVSEEAIALKPNSVTLAEAGAIPAAALAALQAVRDCGNIQAGQRVLVNGASGGVGSFAVQMAKAWGAKVTAVCHGSKLDRVAAMAPDDIIDYTQTDIIQTGQQYDLIIDAAAYRSISEYLPILSPGGTYVMVGGSTGLFLQAALLGPWISKRRGCTIKSLDVKLNAADLNTIRQMVDDGRIVPQIDRVYSLQEVPDAIRYVESRQVCGKVLIQI